MKLLLPICLLIFSTQVFADNLITLNASMSILKCDYNNPGGLGFCESSNANNQPIQIFLRNVGTESNPGKLQKGTHTFTITQNGYIFQGLITVIKDQDKPGCFIEISVTTAKEGDPNTEWTSYIGKVVLKDLEKIDTTKWSGATIKDKGITLTTEIAINQYP